MRWKWLILTWALSSEGAGGAAPRCRALDVDGRSIVEVDASDAIDCRRLVKEAVRRLCCDPEVERFRFLIQYGKERPSTAEVFCEKKRRQRY